MKGTKRPLWKSLAAIVLTMIFVLSLTAMPQETHATVVYQNLLVNGNAEKGTIKGWKATTKNWKATDGEGYGGTCTPYKGKYFFWAPNNYENTSTLYQDVAVKSNQIGKKAVASAYMAVWNQNPPDIAKLKISFLNSKGKTISWVAIPHNKAEWKKYSVSRKIPKGTKKIRVSLIAIRKSGMTDAYFDNVSLIIK